MAEKKIPQLKRDIQLVMLANTVGDAINPAENSATPTGVSTTSYFKTSAAGTIAAGAFSVAVINSGTANGTIKGEVLTPDEFPPAFEAAPGTRLEAIPYDATGTEFTFSVVA